MALIDYYISQTLQNTTPDKTGGTHACFLFQTYALLKGVYEPKKLEKLIKTTHELYEQGVAVVPTVEYKEVSPISENNVLSRCYVLQRRAPGKELHSASHYKQPDTEYQSIMTALSQRPQEFFDKYASDWLKICKSGLQIDPSKSSNFFYTPEKIHFIDLEVAGKKDHTEYAFLDAATALFNGGAYYKQQNKENHKIILNKMVNAFLKQDYPIENIEKAVQNNWPDIAQYSLKDIKNQNLTPSQNLDHETR